MTTNHTLCFQLLRFCFSPDDDDDDFVWPPTTYWSPNGRKLEVKDADAERLLKDKKLPTGGMCAYW